MIDYADEELKEAVVPDSVLDKYVKVQDLENVSVY